MDESSESFAEILGSLHDEFIDEARERISHMIAVAGTLGAEGTDPAEAVQDLWRTAHNIKGMATTFQFPFLGQVAHRLEDYLAQDEHHTPEQIRDIEAFLDQMHAVLDFGAMGQEFSKQQQDTILKSLPIKEIREFKDVPPLDIEVLLVTAVSAQTLNRGVTRELASLGYRVVSCYSSTEALGLATQMRPDLVISSLVMAEISGIDLARAMGAMPTTALIPFCLLTSYAPNDPRLADLPETAAVLRIGKGFAEDLAEAFLQFKII